MRQRHRPTWSGLAPTLRPRPSGWKRPPTTSKRAVRKEVERCILWGLHARGKELSQMGVMDIHAYVKFMANPQPAQVWISSIKQPR
jgi:hypothetical protein